MSEHTAENDAIRDHPWTVCPGPGCPFHVWPVDRVIPPGKSDR